MAGWQDRIRAFVTDSGIREMILLPPECDFGPLKDPDARAGRALRADLADQPRLPVPGIVMDDRAAAREVVEHLFSLGHSGSATSPATRTTPPAPMRRNGFNEAYAARRQAASRSG
jgi:LacI family transcriptional regulator